MKKLKISLLLLLSFLFGAIVFVYVGNTIGWDSIFNSFKILFTLEGLLIVVLSFFIAFLGALRWREIIKDEDIHRKISLWRVFKIYMVGFSVVYLFPIIIFGSELLRASLLEHKEKIGFDKALASVIIERIIEWTINVIVILLATLYFFFRFARPSENIIVVLGIAFSITLIIILLVYFYIFRKKSFLRKFLLKFSKEGYRESVLIKTEKILFNYFNVRNKNLWKAYFLSILKVLSMLLRIWLIIFFLGTILKFMPSFSILGFSFLSTLIPIPATLGIQELIQAFAFENLNINLSISTTFSMLLRAGDVIVSISGFVLFFKAGYDFLKGKVFQK